MLHQYPEVHLVIQFLGLGGLIFSLNAMYKMLKNFEISRIIFFLIFLDNAISCVSCIVIVINGIYLYFDVANMATCLSLFLSLYSPSYFGIVFNGLIAGMRVVTLLKSNENGSLPEKNQRRYAMVSCALSLMVFVSFLVIMIAWEQPVHLVTEFCLRGNQSRPTHYQVGFLGSLVMLWSLLGFISDVYILWSVQAHVSQRKNDFSGVGESKCALMKVPVLATLSSSMILIPYLVIISFGVRVVNLSLEATMALIYILASTMVTVRAPLALKLTFATFKKNEENLKRLSKERRLAWEIHHAQMEQQARKQLRLQDKRGGPKIFQVVYQEL